MCIRDRPYRRPGVDLRRRQQRATPAARDRGPGRSDQHRGRRARRDRVRCASPHIAGAPSKKGPSGTTGWEAVAVAEEALELMPGRSAAAADPRRTRVDQEWTADRAGVQGHPQRDRAATPDRRARRHHTTEISAEGPRRGRPDHQHEEALRRGPRRGAAVGSWNRTGTLTEGTDDPTRGRAWGNATHDGVGGRP